MLCLCLALALALALAVGVVAADAAVVALLRRFLPFPRQHRPGKSITVCSELAS